MRYSEGFHTTVFPAASAGASFHAASISGEFHGVIAAITPSGSSRVKLKTPGLVDRDHAAFDLIGETAEVVEPLRDVFQLRPHLRDELPVVGSLDLGEPFGFRRDQVGEPAQKCSARRGIQFAPIAVESGPGSGDGAIDIGGVSARNQRPRCRRKRIDRLEPFARLRLDPLAARSAFDASSSLLCGPYDS